jgi:hypothetical protein
MSARGRDVPGTDDALDPRSITPVVVALSSNPALDITGRCFHVFGRNISVLTRWDIDPIFTRLGALGEMVAQPHQPVGGAAMVEGAGGAWPSSV